MPDKSTPTPWIVSETAKDGWQLAAGHYINGADGEHVAYAARSPEDAALIVRAVNRDHLFGELVEALKVSDLMIAELVDWFTVDPDHKVSVAANAEVTRRVIRALIAKVEASDA